MYGSVGAPGVGSGPAGVARLTWGTCAARKQAKLHVVESIPRTSEVIAAGRLGADGEVVLVHTKLHPQRGAADCLIKCNDNSLAQSLSSHLRKVLA